MPTILKTYRPWYRLLLDIVRDTRRGMRETSLRQLNARELADIGVDASEIASIQAEALGQATATRLRIVTGVHQA